MSTFVYAPGCKVYIDTYKHGILDVSDDLINGAMQRRSDGVSQFQFSLNNARRKYDRVFMPNDRIIVMMKRLTWLQVFTGYLNELPMFTSWPRVVPLTASCSLKRLQYFYWDPTIAASKQLVQQSLINDQTGQTMPDGGVKQVIINLLEEVVDWSGSRALEKPELAGAKIHIGGIPKTWFDLAANVAREVAANSAEEAALARQLLADAGGLPTVAGQEYSNGVMTGNGAVPAGSYDGKSFTAEQTGNAGIIIKTLVGEGATQRQIAMALACAMVESSLKVLDHGDRAGPDSRGLYQQRANGWGSYEDRMNPVTSTLNFYKTLKQKDDPSKPFYLPIQQTQVSGHPMAYAKYEKAAMAMLAAYNSQPSTLAGDNYFNSGNVLTSGNSTPGSGSAVAGAKLVERALQIVNSRQIPYDPPKDSTPNTSGLEAVPIRLDCSAFVRHVMFKTTGSIGEMPRAAHQIFAWAIQGGGRKISVEQAKNIPGALVGITSNGQASGVTHCEMSTGNGKTTVGAHRTGTVASEARFHPGYNIACLLPGVSYSVTTGSQAQNGSVRANEARGAVMPSGSPPKPMSPGKRIADAARQVAFGEPGDVTNRTDVVTPWGFTVRGVHRAIAGQFQAALQEASTTSSYVPAQIQCLPENDASGKPRREIRGYPGTWSLHSYGLAFDIFNTQGPLGDVFAATFAPDEAFRNAFKRHGFHAGADYSVRKDYPHIEWAGSPPGTDGIFTDGSTGAATLGSTGIPLFIDASATNTDVASGLQSPSELDSLFGSVPWINPAGFATDVEGNFLRGIRALQNDTAILEYIGNLCKSTMRSYCSAPNGDFIAWFPDYYGKWKTAAKMILEPIEVKDFTVTWSDEHMVTHQYVSGAIEGKNFINYGEGTIGATEFYKRSTSAGIATIDQPGMMSLLFGIDQTEEETVKFTQMIYQRFGPRPAFAEIPGITGPKGEFFMAIFLFMQGWAYQFNANIDITFMPELYPGMLIQFPKYNFQAYVTQVDHTFAFDGGGFMTTINISSPAKIKDDGEHLYGLPIGPGDGSSNPLRGKDDIMPTPPVAATRTSSPLARTDAAKINRLER